MTRYMLDKVLWQYAQQPAIKAAFDADPASVLAGLELSSDEYEALLARDIRAIFGLGAHPFLVYSFAIQMAGGWSYQMMLDYVATLKGLVPGDIET